MSLSTHTHRSQALAQSWVDCCVLDLTLPDVLNQVDELEELFACHTNSLLLGLGRL